VDAWRCQATDALNFSTPLKTSDVRQYWREARNGNFTTTQFLRLMGRAVVMEAARRLRIMKALPFYGPPGGAGPSETFGLRPGERVQVRPAKEIAATLDDKGTNRGLSFDREMVPYCGRTMRVYDTVDKIVDDKTGRMLKIPKDSIILEGAVCSGERTAGCWFCPREIYPFWREAWVRPLENGRPSDADSARG
jgi:hypothetical protein